MAITYENISTAGITGGLTSIAVTKNTGLAVGDLMVAGVIKQDSSTISAPAGWTQISQSSPDHTTACFYKVATSGDVAATDFTFTSTGATGDMGAFIIRISGHGAGGGIVFDSTNTTNNLTFTGGVTPVAANSLLIFFVTAQDSTISGNVDSYAITTSNPSWTERYESKDTAGTDTLISVATALRPEATATGDYTVTGPSGSSLALNGTLIAIAPQVDASLSPSAITVTTSVPTPSLSYGTSLSLGSVNATSSVPTPTLTTEDNPWSNQNKNSASPTNQNKNISTANNQSKNISVWNNLDKS